MIQEHEEIADLLMKALDDVTKFKSLDGARSVLARVRVMSGRSEYAINDYEREIIRRACISVQDCCGLRKMNDPKRRQNALEDIGRIRNLKNFRAKT